jgi:hypothetical protein
MPWIRLDANVALHPQFTQCSPAACWFWIAAVAYCERYDTAGILPNSAIASLTHLARPTRCIRALLDANLLRPAPDGYQVLRPVDWPQERLRKPRKQRLFR